jgi:hypothetical protein
MRSVPAERRKPGESCVREYKRVQNVRVRRGRWSAVADPRRGPDESQRARFYTRAIALESSNCGVAEQ